MVGPESLDDASVVRRRGKVIESLPSAMFKVALADKSSVVIAHISGRMRRNHIRVLPGDEVDVEMSPYDLTRGRLVYRYK